MTSGPPRPGAAVREAVTAWGLDGPVTVMDLGGSFNRNLRLRTGGRDLVLRIYRPYVDAPRLTTVATIRDAARDTGLPVPPTIPTADGREAVEIDGCLAELEPWVADDGGTDDWPRADVAAGLLGRLHAALAPNGADRASPVPTGPGAGPATSAAGWSGPLVPPPVSTAASDDVLSDWLDRTDAALAGGPGGADRDVASGAVTGARHLLDRLTGIDLTRLPRQVTHGDFGHANLRFRAGQPVALLDFDFAGVRPRVADLADLGFAPHWLPSFEGLDRPPAARGHDRVARLIAAYDATAPTPLSADEIAALPVLMARLPVAWVAMGWLMADPVAAVVALAPELPTAAWLLDRRQSLAGRWLDLTGARP